MRLQDELSGTENRIGVARRRYNETLRDYNTFVRNSPTASGRDSRLPRERRLL
jgi:LemA protein